MTMLNSECARKWWAISAATGVVAAFVLAAVLGVPWFASLLFGVIVAGVMGYVTVRTNCEQADIETARPQEPARPATTGAAGPAATPSAPPSEPTTPADPAPGRPAESWAGAQQPEAAGDAAPRGDAPPAAAAGNGAASPAQPSRTDPGGEAGTPPPRLDAPRGGQPDDLKRIRGLGPKFEERLNEIGIYHFDQIAAWGAAEVTWVETEMNMSGRVEREDWIAQARRLAAGETE